MNLKQARCRRALATVVTSAIMMAAVSTLGGAGVVWSQSSLNSQQMEMTDTVSNYVNKINESFVFEYVYCDADPCDSIVVVLTNVGDIGFNISEINITDKISGFSKTTLISKGSVMSDKSIAIVIDDPSFQSYDVLDVVAKTNRGNLLQTQIHT